MKPLFTFSLLLLCLDVNVVAQPAFTDPNIVEDVYPNPTDADLREPVSHATAYSYGSLNIGGTNSDLYVYTWDNGDGLPTSVGSGAAGFAVRQYAAGTIVQSTTAPLFEDAVIVGDPVFPTPYIGSLEAGILREGTTTYIVVTYYAGDWLPPIFEGFYYVDLYEWTAGGLVQVGGYPQMLNGATGPVQPGWIHHDINELSELVVTWDENGEIHTLTGNMSGGLQLTGTGILDNPGFNTTLAKPDVTMFRNMGNEITLYYVFTSVAGNALFVTSTSYNNLATLPAGSINPYPVNIIDETSGAGVYDVPRIDAPDHALYAGHEAWSYVVSEHLPDRDLIFTGFYNDQAGGQQHYYLNDGSIGTIDLSGNPTQDPAIYSQRAVVAFSDNGRDMYYGWCFKNQGYVNTFYPFWNAPGVYASLKLDAFGNVLNPTGGTGAFDYSRVQDNTTTTDYMPSVAFSTQNDSSPRLFASFFQNFLGEQNYFIGVKTTDWTSAVFRPGTSGIAESRIDADLTIYPNPFRESFTIAVDGVEPSTVFNLNITDISGRVLYSLSGSVNELNQQLSVPARQLGSGVYFMQLQDAAGKLKDLRKLVKL